MAKVKHPAGNLLLLAGEHDADSEQDEADLLNRRLTRERLAVEEIEAELEEMPVDEDGDGERGKLKRELKAAALARLEDAARTPRDFMRIVQWWNRLDQNRERRERKYELLRSGDEVPLDHGEAANALFFPDTLNDGIERQLRKGEFLDAIYCCPYEIHELVSSEALSKVLLGLKDDQKLLLFLWAVRQYSSVKIAAIRKQTDRNIRKIRNTMMRRIYRQLLAALEERERSRQEMDAYERTFLAEAKRG